MFIKYNVAIHILISKFKEFNLIKKKTKLYICQTEEVHPIRILPDSLTFVCALFVRSGGSQIGKYVVWPTCLFN